MVKTKALISAFVFGSAPLFSDMQNVVFLMMRLNNGYKFCRDDEAHYHTRYPETASMTENNQCR